MTNRGGSRSGSRTPVPHTPSPLALTKNISSRPRKNSRGSLTHSPVVSPTVSKSTPGQSKSNSKGADPDVAVDIVGSPLSLCRSLFDTDKCPCNQSLDCWKIDCSKCHQFWHIDCVTLDGLEEDHINRLINWQCPFCYTAPVSTTEITDESSCLTCRNTRTLREANHGFETSKVAAHLKLVSSDNLAGSEILSQENSIKCIESELQQLHESYQTDMHKLTNEVLSLKSELAKLSSTALQAPPPSSAIQEHDTFLKSVSERLDAIINGSQGLSASPFLNIDHTVPPAPHLAPPTLHDPTIPTLVHNEHHITDMQTSFIDPASSARIITFLESCTFKTENGHSVLAFGAPYSYNGSKLLSKSGDTPPMIPELIKPLLEKINSIQTELYYKHHPEHKRQNLSAYVPQINSCLINRYEGPHGYLPLHADDEVTIDPESSIFTVSLGVSGKVKFIEQDSDQSHEVECPPLSLYHMTRKSQDHFKHCIEEGSIAQGIRYSLTFRSVNWTNRNSTCIVGDSNTGFLRFGENSRSSFGTLMPGRKFWAPRIENIDPTKCSAYNNVVILCGINDLKQSSVSSQHDIRVLCDQLMCKIKQINKLNKKCSMHVCPLLPTKDVTLNKRVNYFNFLLCRDLASLKFDVRCVQGFQGFAEHDGKLVHGQLSKTLDKHNNPDMLHLNQLGARVLAGLIKRSIFLRLNRGVDKRKGPSNRVNGRPFSSVSRGPPPHLQWGGRDGCQIEKKG
ncbi:hypothetical protein ACHWQZ_G018991 [Mnemiopsis leidyi]